MTKFKVGGITNLKGITFVGQKTKVNIRNKDGAFIVRSWTNPSANKKTNIPFIRGFFKLYSAIKMAAGTIIGKISIFFLVLSIISFILELVIGGPKIDDRQVSNIYNIINMTVTITLLTGILIYVVLVRKRHGLEHKIINAYNKDLPITVQNVKKQNKETSQCGGTLLGIFFLIYFVWSGVFRLPYSLLWLVLPSIGYELFLYARGNRWYNKLLYSPGWVIQQLTTGHETDDTVIDKYVCGFNAFICQEDS